MILEMTKTRTKRQDPDPLEEPGAPGSIPVPDHETEIPAAPATHPPEPPIVPSDSAIGEFINSYGPTLILVGAGLVVALILLFSFDF